MVQLRIHGRGGQGVVTAAEILSVAAFAEGRHAQAFPSFGSERMGAPVVSFCRIDDRPIQLREPISVPDAVVIQDPTLLADASLTSGVAAGGYVLINSNRPREDAAVKALLARLPAGHVRFVAATDIARKFIGRPMPNAAMLGALAALTGWVRLESVADAIGKKFAAAIAAKNVAAARAAYEAINAATEPAIA